ncbi:MarR family transcriptional regulator, partial [Streptomyces lonegramiae]
MTTRKFGLLGHVRGNPGISFSELARRSRITVQSAHAAVASF